jgi:hypothetical protein
MFTTPPMQKAEYNDAQANKNSQFGIGNFFKWVTDKYPKLTLAQVEAKLPALEREYAQEKTMRKQEPDMVPSVNSAFDDENERKQAKGLESIQRMQHLAGISINEEEVTKDVIGHTDNETGMISQDLYHIGKTSVDIHKLIKELPDSDFPHWWQSKVVKAKEYIEAAHNYLDAEINGPQEESPEVSPEISGDQDPSGVS